MLKISNYLPKFLKKSKIKVDIETMPLGTLQKSNKGPKAELSISYTSSREHNKYNPRLDKWYNLLTEEERKEWMNDRVEVSTPTNSHVNNFHHEEQKEYADLFNAYFHRLSRDNTNYNVKNPFDSNLSKYRQLEENFKILEDRNKLLEKKLKMLEEHPEKYKMLKNIDPFDEENWESL